MLVTHPHVTKHILGPALNLKLGGKSNDKMFSRENNSSWELVCCHFSDLLVLKGFPEGLTSAP